MALTTLKSWGKSNESTAGPHNEAAPRLSHIIMGYSGFIRILEFESRPVANLFTKFSEECHVL